MAEIVGVRFKPVGKVYYFATHSLKLAIDDRVIVETSHGIDCGWVVILKKICYTNQK